jgi:hypothetical protein
MRPGNSHSPISTLAPGRRLGFGLRVAWLRLRFVAIVGALFAVVLFWRQLGGYWDHAVAWISGTAAHEGGVSADTQYFCPMCPGVLSAWPDKCPVCKMPLVRRAVGATPLLPEGVTARMQISPYRLQLGGIQTSAVAYLPLTHEVRAGGLVSRDDAGWLVTAAVNPWDAPLLRAGMPGNVEIDAAPAAIRAAGTIESIDASGAEGPAKLLLRIDSPPEQLSAGAAAEIAIPLPLASLEPFRSQPRDPPPLAEGAPRQYFVCPQHPTWIRAQGGKCPFDEQNLEPRELRSDQRLHWTCVLHSDQRADQRGDACPHCNRGCQVAAVVDYAPPGEVLAVPASAVIDTGRLKTVFVERMPGMFDAVEVRLGTMQGNHYPVLAGISPGDRVATSGAFLLDAETRLDPALAAGYFGAGSAAGTSGSGPAVTSAGGPTSADRLAGLKLSADDRILAARQGVCPITRFPLGSMGELVAVEVDGRPVFLCCAGCRGKIKSPAPSPPAASEGPRP